MKATFNNTQIAQFYKKENKTKLSAKIIRDIIYSYFDLITNDIASGKRVTLAYLGDIVVKKKKLNYDRTDRLPIDFYRTKKLRKEDAEFRKNKGVVRLLNEHSDGYVAHCYWIKLYSPLENSQFFNFTPFYTLKKKIYKQTIDNIYVYEDYIKGLP